MQMKRRAVKRLSQASSVADRNETTNQTVISDTVFDRLRFSVDAQSTIERFKMDKDYTKTVPLYTQRSDAALSLSKLAIEPFTAPVHAVFK
jgi:hypothetical protein